MSYDPFASGSDVPPEYDPTALPRGNLEGIKSRVQAPAIALIVVGILDLLGACWGLFNSITATLTPAKQFHQQVLELYQAFPQLKAEVSKRSPEELKNQSMFISWTVVIFGLTISMLTIAGGVRMLSLKNYALAICGAISAAIPCISCGGCCLFGEAIGIWALVVLLNNEVREAFH